MKGRGKGRERGRRKRVFEIGRRGRDEMRERGKGGGDKS